MRDEARHRLTLLMLFGLTMNRSIFISLILLCSCFLFAPLGAQETVKQLRAGAAISKIRPRRMARAPGETGSSNMDPRLSPGLDIDLS